MNGSGELNRANPPAGPETSSERGNRLWLAAYTRPHHENQVCHFLQQRDIPVFLPSWRRWRRWSDRSVCLTMPLFPSYVFVFVDERQRQRVSGAPGFLWFVRNRQGPIPVDGDEIEALRRALTCGLGMDPLPWAQVGDEVEITSGALRGYRGHLISKEPDAVALAVSAIHGLFRVCLPGVDWIRAVRPRVTVTAGSATDNRVCAAGA